MNIFVLDLNPYRAAQMHGDKHVVKMILESVQLLNTANWWNGIPHEYNPTHQNHPCVHWTMESRENYNWLMHLTIALHEEWRYRFNYPRDKFHKSYEVFQRIADFDQPRLPDKPMTPFRQCMPEAYRGADVVQAYRAYYIGEKSHLHQYTKRNKPEFLL